MADRCAWCAEPFTPDHRRRYCSVAHRIAMAHYLEAAPGWRAELAQLEASAAGWTRLKKPVPVYLRNLISDLRDKLDRGRQPRHPTPDGRSGSETRSGPAGHPGAPFHAPSVPKHGGQR